MHRGSRALDLALQFPKPFYAFVSSCCTIAALTFLFGFSLFPNLIDSSINPDFNLTIYNAASSEKTLGIMQPHLMAEKVAALRARGVLKDADEAEAIARLTHPNLITLFEVGRSDHGPFLVFELLRGKTLDLRIEEGPLPVQEAVHVATEVARGLAHAHADADAGQQRPAAPAPPARAAGARRTP